MAISKFYPVERNSIFYLTDVGQNVICSQDVIAFTERNPTLKPFIVRHPPTLRLVPYPLFESLCYWIVSQQIGGRVANKMIEKFRRVCPRIEPKFIFRQQHNYFRDFGLSRAKTEAIQNLAAFMLKHENFIQHNQFTSKEAISFFTQVKGIGEWTIQMHLIFGWGHLDILAAKDLAVRKGIQILCGLNNVPTEKQVKECCQHWGELSTLGTLLAWAVKGE